MNPDVRDAVTGRGLPTATLLGLELVLLLGLAIGLAAAGGREPFTLARGV